MPQTENDQPRNCVKCLRVISRDNYRQSPVLERLAQSSILVVPGPTGSSNAGISIDTLRSTLGTVNPAWAAIVDRFPPRDPRQVTAGEFALIAADILKDRSIK